MPARAPVASTAMLRVRDHVDAGGVERRRLVAGRLQVEAEIACGGRAYASTKTSAIAR